MTDVQQRIGRTVADSAELWPQQQRAPATSPNVVVIVLDDVGFSHYSCFGSTVETPNIDRLAAEGLRYTNFHTTAVCSPTRASLLTGRNCHAVGFGHVTERLAGYPGYSMRLPDSAATVAEILRQSGYSTRAVGKWHLTPSYETGPQGPFERWPLGRGFDRFFGFLGGSTDQWAPELYRDNTPIADSDSRPTNYHLSAELVDESITQLGALRSAAPLRPFFLYLAFGAGHAPHQAPREWIDRYRGRFDAGWDEERDRILARQIAMGIVPEGTQLGPSNPGVKPWKELASDEQRLYARMMEVYAGFISYTDAQIGRLLDFLETSGVSDSTLVMLLSDNGASAEGGPEGSVDEGFYLNDRPQRAEDAMRHLEDLGGPKLYNHYPWGWAQAGNTPFRWYKQFTHAGGITNGLIVRWPAGGVPAGELRSQYHHAIDITPTILDAVGITAPAQVRGVTQQPMHGLSMRYSFTDPHAESRRHTQHYEMWGNRGLWRDGWMAICRLHPDAPGAFPPAPMETSFDQLKWELYDHRSDPTECRDLANEHPGKLRELEDLWWAAAGKYDVLPVDNRPRAKHWPTHPPRPAGAVEGGAVFRGAGGPFERGVAPAVAGTSFTVLADVDCSAGPTGVLYSVGGRHGGYCLYLMPDRLCLEIATSSVHTETVSAPLELPAGRHSLAARLSATEQLAASVELLVNGHRIGAGEVSSILKRVPIGSGRTYVGSAPRGTVSGSFLPPYPFTGTVHFLRVVTGTAEMIEGYSEVDMEMREQ